jgi:hypothetical protein
MRVVVMDPAAEQAQPTLALVVAVVLALRQVEMAALAEVVLSS